ncbi:MAG TPA: IS3 family transposase, partial [Bdellovibrio sp.]|nr:IS3 family transposase [Bdellovibrio sp.]
MGSVKKACEMIGISTSTYYYKPKRSRLERAKEDLDIKAAIEKIRKDLPVAGYRTLQRYLLREHGIKIGETKLRRIIRENNLQAEKIKRFVKTTWSEHDELIYPNLLPEMTVTDVNQVWVADLTYIRVLAGFVYLAAILDVYSRKVIGWAISTSLDRKLTVAALTMAIEKRNPKPGVIHHSDRGVQYLCKEYVELLHKNGFHISCSRKGNPYDNAFAESFFKTLKSNEVDLQTYRDIWDVTDRVSEFLDDIYNERRVHSKLDYISP